MNLEHVARRARVSTATVSRVLNNAGVVRVSTRQRVMQAIEELRYHPNLHARSLAGGRSGTIGVIVSNLENPFFFDIYKTVERGAHARGYEVLIANTDYRAEQLVASVRLMIGRRVEGLAAVVSEMDPELIRELAESRMPVVFYDVGAPRGNIVNIRVNYARGIERIVDHLFGLGHRRLGFIGHHATLGPLGERVRAAMDAVGRYPSIEVRAAAGGDTLEGGRQAAQELLGSGYRPTALICVNDITAVGALQALRSQGIQVPRDMSVTGFDNIALSEFCYPGLTTVDIPRQRIGRIICESLIPAAESEAGNGPEILIEPELVLRDSTGPAPPAGAP